MQHPKTLGPVPLIKTGWLRVLVFFIGFILTTIFFQVFASGAIMLVTEKSFHEIGEQTAKGNMKYLFVLQFFSLLGTLLLVWIFRKFIDRRTFQSLGFALKGRLFDILLGMLAGFALMAVGFYVLKALNMLEVVGIKFDPAMVAFLFVLCLFISLNEEILMRGYALNNLMTSFNKWISLGITALLFALLHGFNPNMNILSFTNLILAGVLLGISYIHTKNLWFPIALHLSWNFFQGPIFGFEVSGVDFPTMVTQNISGSELWTGGEFGFEGSLLATLLMIISIVIFNFYYQRKSPDVYPSELDELHHLHSSQ